MSQTVRKFSLSGVVAATLATSALLASPAWAEGLTLKVFGGSSFDQLAPRQTPDVQKEIQKQVFEGFLKSYPAVEKIDWDAQGPIANSLQRVMTAKLANQEIDIIACPAFWVNGAYARRGVLRPISEEELKPFADNIEPAALGAFTISGKVYGVPITTMSTSAIFYNVELFEKMGIAVPPSYEDLKAAAPKLAEAGIVPLLHQGSNTPMWPMWYFETLSQASGDAVGKSQTNLDGTTKFNDAADTKAFALIKKWVDDGILSSDSLSVDQDGMRAAFASGKSAMYYGGTWEVPSLQESVKDFSWGAFAFPKMPDTPGEPKHGGGADNGMCLSSSIAPEKVEAALAFLAYLTKPDVATLYLAPEQPMAASIKGVPVIEDQYAKNLRASAFPNTIKFLDWIWPSEVSQATASAIAGVVGGQMTPQEASDSVQTAFDSLVAEGNWPPKD